MSRGCRGECACWCLRVCGRGCPVCVLLLGGALSGLGGASPVVLRPPCAGVPGAGPLVALSSLRRGRPHGGGGA